MSGDCCSNPKSSSDAASNVVEETCCEFHPPQRCGPAQCPECRELGKAVQKITLEALVKPDTRARIPHQKEFCFCKTPTCDVVYFLPGRVLFRKDDLSVRVGIKENEDPIPLCYCFGWDRRKIWNEIRQTGRATAIESITKEVKAGNCFCERSNPQGSCCLGNISKVVKEEIKLLGLET